MSEPTISSEHPLLAHIQASQPDCVQRVQMSYGEMVVFAHAERIAQLLKFLRDDPQCDCTQLIDISGVDWPERHPRFDVVYQLLSVHGNHRIRVIAGVAEGAPIGSVLELFSAAGWYEREVWDMYGVLFSGNPDLRRILTDYGFNGHPQRRDFPLTGYVELRYDEERKRVVYEPVKLNQAYRNFDYQSPWEGDVLPGDEKASSGV